MCVDPYPKRTHERPGGIGIVSSAFVSISRVWLVVGFLPFGVPQNLGRCISRAVQLGTNPHATMPGPLPSCPSMFMHGIRSFPWFWSVWISSNGPSVRSIVRPSIPWKTPKTDGHFGPHGLRSWSRRAPFRHAHETRASHRAVFLAFPFELGIRSEGDGACFQRVHEAQFGSTVRRGRNDACVGRRNHAVVVHVGFRGAFQRFGRCERRRRRVQAGWRGRHVARGASSSSFATTCAGAGGFGRRRGGRGTSKARLASRFASRARIDGGSRAAPSRRGASSTCVGAGGGGRDVHVCFGIRFGHGRFHRSRRRSRRAGWTSARGTCAEASVVGERHVLDVRALLVALRVRGRVPRAPAPLGASCVRHGRGAWRTSLARMCPSSGSFAVRSEALLGGFHGMDAFFRHVRAHEAEAVRGTLRNQARRLPSVWTCQPSVHVRDAIRWTCVRRRRVVAFRRARRVQENRRGRRTSFSSA